MIKSNKATPNPLKKQKLRSQNDVNWIHEGVKDSRILQAFLWEVSQALKAYYVDDNYHKKQKYVFARDYSAYFPISVLSSEAKKLFSSPFERERSIVRQACRIVHSKIGVHLKRILMYFQESWRHHFFPTGKDALKSEKISVGVLFKTKKGLEMSIPKWDVGRAGRGEWEFLSFDSQKGNGFNLLDRIMQLEAQISKEEVCQVLSLPSPVNPQLEHSLLLLVKVKCNGKTETIGTLLVPSNASLIQFHDWIQTWCWNDVSMQTEYDDICNGWSYLNIKDTYLQVKMICEKDQAFERKRRYEKLLGELAEIDSQKKYGISKLVSETNEEFSARMTLREKIAIEESFCILHGFVTVSFAISGIQILKDEQQRPRSWSFEDNENQSPPTTCNKFSTPVVGSFAGLLKTMKPDLENPTGFETVRYVQDCAIADAIPSLEETFYKPAKNVQGDYEQFHGQGERYQAELVWSKSAVSLLISAIGRSSRLPDTCYPVISKTGSSLPHFW